MIRKAEFSDLASILEIYAYAREFMKQTGNPTQWGSSNPTKNQIEEDIKASNMYALADDEGIYAVFSLIYGSDPSYMKIYDGSWLYSSAYATIHRLASSGRRKNIFNNVVEFALDKYKHLRIDTHQNNKIMQGLILRAGFKYCGIIYMNDNTPRLAYEYLKY